MANTRTLNPALVSGIHNTTGTWTMKTASNANTFDHTAAAETSVANIPVPRLHPTRAQIQDAPSAIAVAYSVGTADLSGAPTAVLNKYTYAAATGVVTRTAVTQSLTFSGADTVGIANGAGAAGTHVANITITTPTALDEDTQYELELSFPCAGTSALKILACQFTYV